MAIIIFKQYKLMSLCRFLLACIYSQICFSDHLYSATTCIMWPELNFHSQCISYIKNLYLVTTCLIWPYFNVPLGSHIRQVLLCLHCHWRSNYQTGFDIPLSVLTPPYGCACFKPGAKLPTQYVVVFLYTMVQCERWLFVLLIVVVLLTIAI